MPVRPFGRIVRIFGVTECFGSSVRVPAISSESPSSDAARASEMANERTIGQDRPSPLRCPCPLRKRTRRTQDPRIAGEQEPRCVWPGYLRASLICPKW